MTAGVLQPNVEIVSEKVEEAFAAVHRKLGPGLLESIYKEALHLELCKRGLKVAPRESVPVIYDGQRLAQELELDLVVNQCVVVDVRSVDQLTPIHTAQLYTAMKLSGIPVGFLVNFNVLTIENGVERIEL